MEHGKVSTWVDGLDANICTFKALNQWLQCHVAGHPWDSDPGLSEVSQIKGAIEAVQHQLLASMSAVAAEEAEDNQHSALIEVEG